VGAVLVIQIHPPLTVGRDRATWGSRYTRDTFSLAWHSDLGVLKNGDSSSAAAAAPPPPFWGEGGLGNSLGARERKTTRGWVFGRGPVMAGFRGDDMDV
jgi:hypothetical protein